MNTDEIIQKSISGAKWTVILSILAMPLGFIINVILGRLSPEALGIYGLLNIFVSSVTTFILFGGNNLIIKCLPEIEKEKKVSFLISYTIIVILIAIVATVSIYLYPQILSNIFGQEFPKELLSYFILFIPIIILYSVFNFALNGLMEIKSSVFIGKMTVIGYFIVFSILFFFFKSYFIENLWAIIWGLSFALYTTLGLISLVKTIKVIKQLNKNELKKENNEGKRTVHDNIFALCKSLLNRNIPRIKDIKFYLPRKFWSFALFVHLSTILDFIAEKIDQLFILSYFSITELGLYYPALQTAILIRFVPLLIGSVLLPTFSNLIVSNDIRLIRKGYQETIKYNMLIVIPASLFCIFFSKEILGLFGKGYTESYLILVVLATFYSTSSIGIVNNALIIAKGESKIYFLGQMITTVLGIILMLVLINKLGIIGLAIGRGSIVALWQIISILIVIFLKVDVKIPRSYTIGLFISLVAACSYFVIPTQNISSCLYLFIILLISFLYFGGYSREDLDFISQQFLRKQLQRT